MADAIVLKRGGSPGSGVIHIWKQYNVNTSIKYVWDKWELVTTVTYKWEKWSTSSGFKDQESTPTDNYILMYASQTAYTSYTADYSTGTYKGNSSTNAGSKPSAIYEIESNGSSVTRAVFEKNEADSGIMYYWFRTTRKLTMIYSTFKGDTSYGQVTSASSSAYPSNGVSGSYWYVSTGSDTSYSKGSASYGQVESTSSSTYPNPGNHTDGYWYENRQEVPVYSMGIFKQNVYSTNPNLYPQNGKLGDYWYVYDGTISG